MSSNINNSVGTKVEGNDQPKMNMFQDEVDQVKKIDVITQQNRAAQD